MSLVSGLLPAAGLKAADLGCGTGASALTLAKALNTPIEALDLVPEFLARLKVRAEREGLARLIRTHEGSLESPPFAADSLDLVWSEGAIYNLGFRQGLRLWKPLLKDGGIVAVTDLTWLHDSPPVEVEQYWRPRYSGVDTIPAKTAILWEEGWKPLGHFPLPAACWEGYFNPLRTRLHDFVSEEGWSTEALRLQQEEKDEMDLYARTGDSWGYVFFLAQKLPAAREDR